MVIMSLCELAEMQNVQKENAGPLCQKRKDEMRKTGKEKAKEKNLHLPAILQTLHNSVHLQSPTVYIPFTILWPVCKYYPAASGSSYQFLMG